MYQFPETWGVLSPPLCVTWSVDAIQPGATHNIKAAHLALKQRPASELLKAQLSGIFQGIFSPAQIPVDCVCHSVCLCPVFVWEGSLRVLTAAGWGQGGAGKWHRSSLRGACSLARSPSVTLPIKTHTPPSLRSVLQPCTLNTHFVLLVTWDGSRV